MKPIARATARSPGIMGAISAVEKRVKHSPSQYRDDTRTVDLPGCDGSSCREVDDVLNSIDRQSSRPSSRIYERLLKHCCVSSALSDGRRVHSHLVRNGLAGDTYLNNLLITMYCKCDCLKEAIGVFESLPVRDVFAWRTMISAYARRGHFREAIHLFEQLELENVQPNKVTFLSILGACKSPPALSAGRMVHASITERGLEDDLVLGTALVNMYHKCGSIEEARAVFHKMPRRDVVAWTSMIAASSDAGCKKEALDFLRQMQNEGVAPNKITFVNVLKACDGHSSLSQGKLLHAEIVERGFDSDLIVATVLVDMYGKCGSLEDACRVFETIAERDVVSWNTMTSAFARYGYWEAVSDSLLQMEKEGLRPNEVSFLNALQACSVPSSLSFAKSIHCRIIEGRYQEPVLNNALVDMYGRCADLESAKRVFSSSPVRDVVSWNTIIAAFSLHKHQQLAFQNFAQMQLEGVVPDSITFINLFNACHSSMNLEAGEFIHAHVIHGSISLNERVEAAIIRMYDRCGSLQAARETFDLMVKPDIQSWSSIITACVRHSNHKEALHLFWQMHFRGIKSDRETFLTVLEACGSDVILAEAKSIHEQFRDSDFEFGLAVATALIDMYGKIGDLHKAYLVFDHLSDRDFVCWSAMIAAYAQNGRGQEALKLFGHLQLEGIMPNNIALMNVLSACNRAGLVDQGYHHFTSIELCEGVKLDLENYGCMIDLLARSGQLDRAEDLISQMPYEPNEVIWTSLLSGCKIHGDIARGKRAAGYLLKFDPQNPSYYATYSTIMKQSEAKAIVKGQEDEYEEAAVFSW